MNSLSAASDPASLYARARSLVADHMAALERRLRDYCGDEEHVLARAARDAIRAGGKRLRPLLTLLSAAALGEPTDTTSDLALAAEIIHLASLMHDDVVDQAVTRRGHPSVREVWGNRIAVLVGDYLAARAYFQLAHIGDRQYVELFARVAMGMCLAEAASSQASWDTLTEDDCLSVARGKTAQLMGACCRAGALSAGASSEAANILEEFGLHLGIAFQLTDDLLDIYGPENLTGKSPGRDLLTGQPNLPLVVALRSPHGAQVRALLESLSDQEDLTAGLKELADLIELAGGRAHTRQLAAYHVETAKQRIQALLPSSSDAVAALADLADFVLVRES